MITVFTGPMFSGKSEKLFDRLNRARIAKRPVFLFKPIDDTREDRSIGEMASKTSRLPKPIDIKSPVEILSHWKEITAKKNVVIGIDEAQFFTREMEEEFLNVLEKANEAGVEVVIAGLDTNFLHRPFGVMPAILAVAHQVEKRYAVCECCGDEKACYTQRLANGKPAPKNSPEKIVGDRSEEGKIVYSYEPRCIKCFKIG